MALYIIYSIVQIVLIWLDLALVALFNPYAAVG